MNIVLHSGSHTAIPAAPAAQRPPAFPERLAVLIPAWNPGAELTSLVETLIQMGCRTVLVVDDGSSAGAQPVFQRLREMPAITLLRHAHNHGKGCALRTGFQEFLRAWPDYDGVITADADGQHAPEDIARVAAALAASPTRIILGARPFPSTMPWRSRLGNVLTRYAFRAATGVMLADTQTGLRGIPRTLLPELLTIPGDRYEYEMAALTHWCCQGCAPVEVPIQTIYHDHNRSSHFHPLRDSYGIYSVLALHRLRGKSRNPPR